jgi:3-oxoacyl-[acyl-carrier-protein] synthase-3
MIRSQISGSGAYLPERVVTNADLVAQGIDTNDEWIIQRTGIRQRHMAAPGELTSDLAVNAAKAALAQGGVKVDEVDLIIVATTTPDHTFPATAAKVQSKLGVNKGAAFDVQAVCSGFVYALAMADNMIRLGQSKCALVIGAETFSRLLDWNDRTTCVLFGDGAGAVVLRAAEGRGDKWDRAILSTHLHADGNQYELLMVDGGPSTTQSTGHVRMQGQEVFKHAVRRLAEVVEETLTANQIDPSELDWLAPHQANKRIIDGVAHKLKLDESKVILTVDKHGNTSAASIPLALAQGVNDGRIKPGNLVLCEAMGGGFTWGAALIRW